MPELAVAVDGSPVMLGHNKPEELLALLIDRGAAGLTKKDAIDTHFGKAIPATVATGRPWRASKKCSTKQALRI